MNALKNRAKTAAKINVQKALQLDEFRSFRSRYLEFDTNCARPPAPPLRASPRGVSPPRQRGSSWEQQASSAWHGQDGCLVTGSLRGWGLWGQRGSRREGVEIRGKKE